MIHILLLDDHPVLRHGTRALLETQPDFVVIADTDDPEEAITVVTENRIDVALVDLDLGPNRSDGPTTTRLLLRASPGTRVVAFTAFDSDADIVRMVEAGAVGYLLKDSRPAALFSAIRSAATGSAALAGPIAARLLDRMQRPDDALTSRELEVLELAASGLSNRDLARRLLVSEATVKTHLHHAFIKLRAENGQAAIATAIKQGLIRL
ncbi:response regulator transcription factor [Kocuria coralli]|uniref:Response regulator transcription factor n=1 Tax=Kocuria coralli TaxID=1461025 RepID=A0A5J5L178_9MICC|nr:response regulator transcription factor [Kocuria coralli]KAA9395707.1 response regulator transcription factor [Kocuria coralli]